MNLMTRTRHTTGLLALISLAVIGYLLVPVPPRLVEQSANAEKFGPAAVYIYWGLVGTGAAILFGIVLTVLVRVWRTEHRYD